MTQPAPIALLDRAHFAVMTGDDRALQIEIVGLFRDQVAKWRTVLASERPAAEWRAAAHTMKGSARGIGLWPLAEACAAAEAQKDDDVTAIDAHLQALHAALDDALAALANEGLC